MLPSSEPSYRAASPSATSAGPASPSSARDADTCFDATATSTHALDGANDLHARYDAASFKTETMSRFAPFEESYSDMNELRRALKVLSVQKNAPYYMQHSSPQRVEARCPSWRSRKRQSETKPPTGSDPSAVCDFVVSANRHANGRIYVTRAVITHSPTCSVLNARLAATGDTEGAEPGGAKSKVDKARVSAVTASALLETALPFMGHLATSRGGRDAVKPKDVSEIMKEKFGVQPSYMTAWRALSAFRKQRKDEDALSYMKLSGYLETFAATNEGSLVAFEHQASTQGTSSATHPDAKPFSRAFLCPKPLHNALRYCRGSMLLSVFLITSAFGGVVFTATAQDAVGDNVPIAIGLASRETQEEWQFFLQQLRRAFPDMERLVTSLVHNRGDPLTRAIQAIFPDCPQSNEVEIFLRTPAPHVALPLESSPDASTTPGSSGSTVPFQSSMQWMETLCSKAPLMILVGWVSRVARTLFQRFERYGHLSSEYPAEFDSLATEYEGESSHFDVVRTSETEFEVIDRQTSAGRVVNFAKQTCTCGEYDVSRFPCLHVFLAVTHAGMLRTDVIPRIFLMTSLKTLYTGRITPIDVNNVPSDGVTIPQPMPKTRGRPRKVQQIQQLGDFKQEKLSCSVCGIKGHNKRTCKRLARASVSIVHDANMSEAHAVNAATGQDDVPFLVSSYDDALGFDNSELASTGSESHVSDEQALPYSSGKRRRLTDSDRTDERKALERQESETSSVALV
ncbi:hypothetical protein PsorP6_013880 [Peronosclerospora sorghi]|uniref:Uncharacterized protein n=1 Tax=Peronosclerospora sorghi TaxID=230839 RepID=A0ACC0VIT4_9STRA|nr:hypothetical protein PsorP6_013880 [Peronosclerospora sorghi]